ncbi:MAG: DUF1311 domain-containing protein [Pseudomonadales bacterium]|jgi:hypothetical protein|nr:DUF1311 domain-containing protein [Pseudomonadales bacterium]
MKANFVRFLILPANLAAMFFSLPAMAEPTLHHEVLAAQVAGSTIAVLVKVTDTDADRGRYGVTTILPAAGHCITAFTDDLYESSGVFCYRAQLWEDETPVEQVSIQVLETVGDSNWAVLSWKSKAASPIRDRSIRLVMGAPGGLYSDNGDQVFPLGGLAAFNSAHPYAWLYERDDQALNQVYQRMLDAIPRASQQYAEESIRFLREDERRWVNSKEISCAPQRTNDPERCRWLVTAQRIETLNAWTVWDGTASVPVLEQ